MIMSIIDKCFRLKSCPLAAVITNIMLLKHSVLYDVEVDLSIWNY